MEDLSFSPRVSGSVLGACGVEQKTWLYSGVAGTLMKEEVPSTPTQHWGRKVN